MNRFALAICAILLSSAGFSSSAQDSTHYIHFGDPRMTFIPLPHTLLLCEADNCKNFYYLFHRDAPSDTIYGVAGCIDAFPEDTLYFSAKMVGIGSEPGTEDYYYLLDSIPWYPNASNRYYCYDEYSYYDHSFYSHDTIKLTELYFRNPVPAPDSFFLGFFAYNGRDGYWSSGMRGGYVSDTGLVMGVGFPDGAEDGEYHVISGHLHSRRYAVYPFLFAIRQRPDPSLLPQNHVADCPRPDSYRVLYQCDSYLWLIWNTNGMDVEGYEVAWGREGDNPDRCPSVCVDATQDKVKIAQLDTMSGDHRLFWLRTRCHHVCGLDDTVTWGRWGTPLVVYIRDTGVIDTTHDTLDVRAPAWDSPLLTLHPNPSSNLLTVSSSDGSMPREAELLDMKGHVVLRRRADPDETDGIRMDVSRLARGTYLVRLRSSKGIICGKAVIE